MSKAGIPFEEIKAEMLKDEEFRNMQETARLILELRAAGWSEQKINDFILFIGSGDEQYKILKTNAEGYDRLVLCLTFESLLSYIHKIEKALSETETDGTILIDQLLITGDGANRFISCSFSKGKFDFKTAHTVTPEEYYRKETVEFLHDNYCYVENSILTDAQRQKIRDKITF